MVSDDRTHAGEEAPGALEHPKEPPEEGHTGGSLNRDPSTALNDIWSEDRQRAAYQGKRQHVVLENP